MIRKLIIILTGACILLVTIIVYNLYNKKHRSIDDEEYTSISAAQLFDAFEANEANANKMYLDKVVAVTGIVQDVTTNQSGDMIIVLVTNNPLFGVSCTLESKATSVSPGKEVTIKGICTGYLSDVILTNAKLVER
ncbi:MAG TPA: hypothetical protein VFW11_18745 [Cyclobacteriaceae bacterium]|nr:hypothetical protein [Cyclobacteriaceae bacterium]